ncbi:MAG: 3-oxoacid CoA-transferase subunit B [Deltaproteobacteria bacterium]|nr:3-oxoacid CoA-transferase subunit B [Deltaproteobacteria bacterium]
MIAGMNEQEMAQRAAAEIRDGSYVNLGIGMPTLVLDFVPAGKTVFFHTENGLLGMGGFAPKGAAHPDLVDAGKQPITSIKGASFFPSDISFAMMRGGHIDLAIMGAYQVSEKGDLANWTAPGMLPSIGGAMDIAAGTKKIIIMMSHTTKDGKPKLVRELTYPVTGYRCVSMIITNLCVLDVSEKGLLLKELAAGVSVQDVIDNTGALLVIPEKF